MYRKYVTYIHFGPIAIVASLAWLYYTNAHERLLHRFHQTGPSNYYPF